MPGYVRFLVRNISPDVKPAELEYALRTQLLLEGAVLDQKTMRPMPDGQQQAEFELPEGLMGLVKSKMKCHMMRKTQELSFAISEKAFDGQGKGSGKAQAPQGQAKAQAAPQRSQSQERQMAGARGSQNKNPNVAPQAQQMTPQQAAIMQQKQQQQRRQMMLQQQNEQQQKKVAPPPVPAGPKQLGRLATPWKRSREVILECVKADGVDIPALSPDSRSIFCKVGQPGWIQEKIGRQHQEGLFQSLVHQAANLNSVPRTYFEIVWSSPCAEPTLKKLSKDLPIFLGERQLGPTENEVVLSHQAVVGVGTALDNLFLKFKVILRSIAKPQALELLPGRSPEDLEKDKIDYASAAPAPRDGVRAEAPKVAVANLHAVYALGVDMTHVADDTKLIPLKMSEPLEIGMEEHQSIFENILKDAPAKDQMIQIIGSPHCRVTLVVTEYYQDEVIEYRSTPTDPWKAARVEGRSQSDECKYDLNSVRDVHISQMRKASAAGISRMALYVQNLSPYKIMVKGQLLQKDEDVVIAEGNTIAFTAPATGGVGDIKFLEFMVRRIRKDAASSSTKDAEEALEAIKAKNKGIGPGGPAVAKRRPEGAPKGGAKGGTRQAKGDMKGEAKGDGKGEAKGDGKGEAKGEGKGEAKREGTRQGVAKGDGKGSGSKGDGKGSGSRPGSAGAMKRQTSAGSGGPGAEKGKGKGLQPTAIGEGQSASGVLTNAPTNSGGNRGTPRSNSGKPGEQKIGQPGQQYWATVGEKTTNSQSRDFKKTDPADPADPAASAGQAPRVAKPAEAGVPAESNPGEEFYH